MQADALERLKAALEEKGLTDAFEARGLFKHDQIRLTIDGRLCNLQQAVQGVPNAHYVLNPDGAVVALMVDSTGSDNKHTTVFTATRDTNLESETVGFKKVHPNTAFNNL